jgi:hypothetical protein
MRSRSAQVLSVVVIMFASAACDGGDDKTPSTRSSTVTLTTPGPSTTTPASTLKSIPVYYIAESQRSFKLYREFRNVPDTGGAVASAVSAMTRLAPRDPDYMTPWRPARRVSVSREGGNLAVDLSGDAFSNTALGSELAATAVQQLVYTATAAAAQSGTPATTVTITKDGKVADAWGTVRLGSATTRVPIADVQAQAWVTSPQEGDVRKAGQVTFRGFGTSFEATFGWVIRTTAGAKVAQGSAMGGTGTGGFGALSFRAQLVPGTYTVVLSTDDPSGGAEGHGPATDDKTFTVR